MRTPTYTLTFIVALLFLMGLFYTEVAFGQMKSYPMLLASNSFVFNPRTHSWLAISNGKVIRHGRASGGRHYCPDVLSDMDLDKEPASLGYRVLAYLMYPKISFRFPNNAPEDCLLFFYSSDTLVSVPQDYIPVIVAKDPTLILAIKKGAVP